MSELKVPNDENPTVSSHGGFTGAVSGAAKKISSPFEKAFRHPVEKVSSLHRKDRNTKSKAVEDDTTSASSGDSTSFLKNATKKSRLGAEKALKTLSSPVKRMTSGSNHKAKSQIEEEEQDDGVVEDSDLPVVPPDDKIKKMDIIVRKRLKGVSIREFYEIAFSEGNRTDKEPLYGPWLEENGKKDVKVGDWEFAEGAEVFEGKWCGEKYKQKRTVTFVFDKNIPMRAGPTVAKVENTEYCRVDGIDKCVMQRTVDMDGVPFSDCFNVEVRWVATRSGKNDIAVQVGLFVNFVKSTIVAGKIRAGTTEETTKAQLSLFMKIKQACGATAEEVAEVEEVIEGQKEIEQTEHFSCATFIDRIAFWRRHDVLANRDDDIAASARSANRKLKQVIAGLEAAELGDVDTVVRNQLGVVNEALDKILSSSVSKNGVVVC